MKWASGISQEPSTDDALVQAATRVTTQLQGSEPDVVFVFASPEHAPSYPRLPELVQAAFPSAFVFGASAGGVIGGDHREVEEGAALSLTAAVLPGVERRTVRFDDVGAREAPDLEALGGQLGLPGEGGGGPGEPAALLLLADPFSFDVERVLSPLDRLLPRAPKVGGLASGAGRPGEAALFVGDRVHRDGAVGLLLSGNVRVDPIVAQGCRPIGEPFIVTRYEENLILELDRGRPLDVLRRLAESLPQRDQSLLRHSLFLGVQMREQRGPYVKGDFLIRNLLGLDRDRGALAVGTRIEDYQVVQFHLRDAETSADDLRWHLATYRETAGADDPGGPAGALLFSCLGRGEGLYGEPGHDSRAFREELGERVPVGGFFCNGEIGPVGGQTFVHGYTSSFAVFRPREH
jgi:small ligand-binding sensory domain FIST